MPATSRSETPHFLLYGQSLQNLGSIAKFILLEFVNRFHKFLWALRVDDLAGYLALRRWV